MDKNNFKMIKGAKEIKFCNAFSIYYEKTKEKNKIKGS